MTTYTPSLRLWQGVPFDASIKGAWGTPLNTNENLLEAAVLGTTIVSVAGLSNLTLTTANGAADQARNYVQQYTGALTTDCTILLPNVPKFGFARNSTTGSRNIILNAGAGTTATIPPDGSWHYYWTDGATNCTLPAAVFGVPTVGPINGTTGTFSDLISPNSIKGILGTSSADQAQAGSIGEYITATSPSPGANMTNNVIQAVNSVVLGPGDWDIGGNIALHISASVLNIQGWVNPSTVAIPTNPDNRFVSVNLSGIPTAANFPVPAIRLSTASFSTPVFLCAFAGFSSGTCSASGTIWARRAR